MTNDLKKGSTYKTKKGVEMRQINLAVKKEVADKFDSLCDGLSKSVIFTQLVNEKYASSVFKPDKPTYSILGE